MAAYLLGNENPRKFRNPVHLAGFHFLYFRSVVVPLSTLLNYAVIVAPQPVSALLECCGLAAAFTVATAKRPRPLPPSCRLLPPHLHPEPPFRPLTPFLATHPQNPFVNPVFATLPNRKDLKSFVCHTSEKQGGVGVLLLTSASPNSGPFSTLLLRCFITSSSQEPLNEIRQAVPF